jgi:hypothetical protein
MSEALDDDAGNRIVDMLREQLPLGTHFTLAVRLPGGAGDQDLWSLLSTDDLRCVKGMLDALVLDLDVGDDTTVH